MLLRLLTAPVTLPMSGFRFILTQVAEMAERELYDEDRIRDDLLLLQVRLDDGDITEAEYLDQEAAIMTRLRAAREHREQQARGD
ncbi:MAG: gas vesicle protein GvpG [Dehalococcoidia bacterium]